MATGRASLPPPAGPTPSSRGHRTGAGSPLMVPGKRRLTGWGLVDSSLVPLILCVMLGTSCLPLIKTIRSMMTSTASPKAAASRQPIRNTTSSTTRLPHSLRSNREDVSSACLFNHGAIPHTQASPGPGPWASNRSRQDRRPPDGRSRSTGTGRFRCPRRHSCLPVHVQPLLGRDRRGPAPACPVPGRQGQRCGPV